MSHFAFAFLVVIAVTSVGGNPIFGTVRVEVDPQHQGSDSKAADPAELHPTVEIDSVWGCVDSSSKPRTTAKGCVEGSALTISGRNFGRGGARVFLLPVNSKNANSLAGTPIECLHTRHSSLLPSLIVMCDLPPSDDDAVYHVKIAVRNGITAVRRSAVEYQSKVPQPESEKSSRTDAKVKLLNPERWAELGIGGLTKQFQELFRRAFGSRLSAMSQITSNIQLKHVKGIIFYGLPGTGKTLVARKVAEALGSKHVRVVNGPEIMSKFVGDSEKNLRELFRDAEDAWASHGAKADLYVIIIDEIDAIMRRRGSGSDDSAARAVYDGVTTQMLAYMDGVKVSNNLLIIGLTNRLDSLDPALLRPGRFEVQIRFPLPDNAGRLQILEIHTQSLKDSNYLAADVSLQSLADLTASFSGADLAATVRSATSYAMERLYQQALSVDTPTADDKVEFRLTSADFRRGIREVLSAKSASANTEPHLKHGYVVYHDRLKATLARLQRFASDVKSATSPTVLKVLLEGHHESGLTATAAAIARLGNFPHVHIISPDAFVGLSTSEKIERIRQVFDAALQAPASCVVLDSIEHLLEYNGMRSSVNTALQIEVALLLKRGASFSSPASGTTPQENEGRVLVIATSSNADAVRVLSAGELVFDAVEPILALRRDDVVSTLHHYGVDGSSSELRSLAAGLPPSVGIKRLVTWLRVAATRARVKGVLNPISADIFHEEGSETRTEKIPLSVVEEVLVEFGVLIRPTREADAKDDAQSSLHW